MVQNPPEGCQRIIPYLLYKNAAEAIGFLTKAFGFVERFRIPGPDDTVGHSELAYGDNIIMISDLRCAEQKPKDPTDMPGRKCMTCVYVDDVDAHYRTAKAAGASIQAAPEDQFYGDRVYRAVDPEGHLWFFNQHVKDVAPEDMAQH